MSFILLVVSFGELVRSQFSDDESSSSPSKMTGVFNVAVAPFGVAGGGGDARAKDVAASIAQAAYEGIRRNAAAGTQVRSPTEVGPPGSLDALARTINADVVVYGDLRDGPLRSRITPKLYVAPRLLPGAEELVGGLALGAPIISTGSALANPETRRDLAKRVGRRTAALSEFVAGVGSFARNQFERSRRQFQRARASLAPAEGQALVYLFMGSAAARLGRYQAATEHYEQALIASPGYSRARLGLAEVLFQRGKRDCTARTVRLGLLRRARAQYIAARSSPDRPGLADIPVKVSLGLGRIDVCLAQSGDGARWAAAREHLRAVVAEFDRGNARMREPAAQAYAALAIADAPAAGAPKEQYDPAIADLEAALRLTTDPEHERAFKTALQHLRQNAEGP
jgi:tetratricopeptide (TPR) repeat protein